MDPRQKSESDEVSAEKRIGLDELFTDKEAARVLRMSQVTLWRERKEGKITFRRYAGKLFYTSQDLFEYLERAKRGSFDS